MIPLIDLFQILGVVVSIIAFIYAHEARQKSLETEAELAEIEKQREKDRVVKRDSAYLVPRLTRVEGGKYIFEIVNEGEAAARNVEVLADGAPIGNFFYYQDLSSVEEGFFERISPRNRLSTSSRDGPGPSVA